jgi:hypothetical protein
MPQPEERIPIKELTFTQLQEVMPKVDAWVYPKRNISPFIPLFSGPQRAALNFYGWIAIGMVIAGVVLPLFAYSLWYLVLIPGAFMVWKANRQSMAQFFLENLQHNAAFYETVRESEMGRKVEVVLEST